MTATERPAIDLDLAELDVAHEAVFVAALGPLFEGAPRFLARLASGRPYGDWASLFHAARTISRAMPEPEQVEFIDAHPRLGAPPETVSALSFEEQGYGHGGRDGGTGVEYVDVGAELDRLNAAYEARFGFRYCVFVAGRPREALLPDMVAALSSNRGAELRRALDAIVDIAMARLDALRAAGS